MMFFDEKNPINFTRKKAKKDPTILRASRYYTHADYNQHYECKTNKAFKCLELILISQIYTNGFASDYL